MESKAGLFSWLNWTFFFVCFFLPANRWVSKFCYTLLNGATMKGNDLCANCGATKNTHKMPGVQDFPIMEDVNHLIPETTKSQYQLFP